MDITVFPGVLSGNLNSIPSKSQAHRLLICAAFADDSTRIHCPQTNRDIAATVGCLNALGANITREDWGYIVNPIQRLPVSAVLNCEESGSTLRFMLPIAGALGVDSTFLLAGRLPQRPLSPLWEEMEQMGCCLTRPTKNTIRCQGKLLPGIYSIAGNVSSQFITGLMLALPLVNGHSTLKVIGRLESQPYVRMTEQALSIFQVPYAQWQFHGPLPFHSPHKLFVEGDWSNGAFFLAANHLGSNLTISGLDPASRQGDRICKELFDRLHNYCQIDCTDIPDLVPVLSVVAAGHKGAAFTNIRRLRMKESDRVETVISMLKALGTSATADENTLHVYPGSYSACTIDSAGDHRIAMSAAIAATAASGPVTILGAQCVEKSYPAFWNDFKEMGGKYE